MIKKLITLFMCMYTVSAALALDCDQLDTDLIAIEHKILTSELNLCKSNTDNSFCQPKDSTSGVGVGPSHERGKKLLQVEQEYNEAMAKLILVEGLTTVGKTVEDNHNALALLQSNDLSKAKDYMNYLEDSLNKAMVLTSAMEVAPNGDSFWKDFNVTNSTVKDLNVYINNKCEKKTTSQFNELCSQLLGSEEKKVNESIQNNAREAIHGFLSADIQIQDSAVSNRYEKYKKMLEVTSEDQKLTPKEFHKKNTATYEKLKKTLSEFTKNPDQEKAKIIVDIAKKFDGVTVNYNQTPFENSANTNESRVAGFIKDELKGPFTLMGLSDSFLTNGSKANLKKNNDIMSKNYIAAEEAYNTYLEENRDKLNCDGAETAADCLVRRCRPDSQNLCTLNKDQGLEEFYAPIARAKENGKTLNQLKDAHACYEQKTLDAKRACLKSVKSQIPGLQNMPIEKLRSDVIAKRKILEAYNNAAPFKDLQIHKGVVLSERNSRGCVEKDLKIKVDNFTSSCGVQEIQNLAYEALDLGVSGSDTVIKLNSELMKSFASGSISDADMKAYHLKLQKDCKEKTLETKATNLCAFYASEDLRKEQRERELEALRNLPVIEELPDAPVDPNAPSTASIIAADVVAGLAAGAPTLINGYAQMKNTQDWERTQIAQIQAQDRAYQAQLAIARQQAQFYNSQPPITGYGDGYIYNSYTSSSNFQSFSTNSIYSYAPTTTKYNFNFTSNNYSTYGTSPYSVGTSLNSSTPYSFNY